MDLLDSRAALDAYRAQHQCPQAISTTISQHRLMIGNWPTGVGKTYGLLNYIKTIAFEQHDRVFIVLGRRDLMAEIQKKLQGSLNVVAYPDLKKDSICHGEYHAELEPMIQRGLSNLAHIDFCSECPDFGNCFFAKRRNPKAFKDADVVLLTDQYLRYRPGIFEEWGITPRSLVVCDEALGADAGFVHHFTGNDLQVELQVVRSLGPDFLHLVMVLEAVLAGRHAAVNPSLLEEARKEHAQGVINLQRAGFDTDGFKYVTPSVFEFLKSPLWVEGSVFAYRRFPHLPSKVIFLGAYLSPEFITWRYGLGVPPHEIGNLNPPVKAVDAGTKIYNVTSPLAAPSLWPKNGVTIVNAAVDFITSNIESGRTTALLMRKNGEADASVEAAAGLPGQKPSNMHLDTAVGAICAELGCRGYGDVQLLPPGSELPSVPNPRVVPIVTYGMTGLGHYEAYESLFAVHAYHISPEAIRSAAFDDLPPSQRPRVTFQKGKSRELDWSESPAVAPELRRRAQLMYERLELDVTAQAIMRVRPTIWPRLVVVNVRYKADHFLGRTTPVQNLSEWRIRVGLGTTTEIRRGQQAACLRRLLDGGVGLTEAAQQIGIGRTKAQELRSEYFPEVELNLGRPALTTGLQTVTSSGNCSEST